MTSLSIETSPKQTAHFRASKSRGVQAALAGLAVWAILMTLAYNAPDIPTSDISHPDEWVPKRY